jgi:hypothetical protein
MLVGSSSCSSQPEIANRSFPQNRGAFENPATAILKIGPPGTKRATTHTMGTHRRDYRAIVALLHCRAAMSYRLLCEGGTSFWLMRAPRVAA